jgi:acyl-CoA reductase-like NAD-dependent aldehyde dehydrogenase
MQPRTFLVNGEWRSSSRTRTIHHPYFESPAGMVFQASGRDIDDAIAAATLAFRETSALVAYERSGILHAAAAAITDRREEFARTITLETGKPITLSRAEVERSILTFEVAAEEASRIEGTVLPLDLAAHSRGRFGLVRRFPIGPVGAITPFNFPLNLVAHKVAPAIAAGNSVVLKPSSSGVMTALMLGEVLAGLPLPAGAFNVLPCAAGEADQLIVDERIKLISFTGSPAVGWPLKGRAGRKKVLLELGGNAGVIVDRGTNLDVAVPRIAQGAYGNAGQSCIAVQRIYVHQDMYPEFERRFVEYSLGITVGDPRLDTTVVGPMIDVESAAKVEGWIREAVEGGSRLLCGGERNGALLWPTVLTGARADLNVSCQEVFAPVVTLEPYDDFEDAVKRVNASAFGLQAGIFTNDLRNVLSAYQQLEVGGVIINDYPTYRIDHMPYGGVKESGFGREGVRYAIEEMTELKLLAFNVL